MKRRTQPVNGRLKKILQERTGNKFPFEFTYNQVYRRLKKYYEIAGIKNASVHTLRKTCGAILIQNGVDIYRVSDLAYKFFINFIVTDQARLITQLNLCFYSLNICRMYNIESATTFGG